MSLPFDYLTVRHGMSMALIEIDGLPNLKMVIFFPWRNVNVITRG